MASDTPAPAAAVRPAPIAERFVECSAVVPPAPVEKVARLFRAPRCDAASYARWWQPALERVVSVLVRQRREVQLVASVPIPETGSRPDADLAAFLSAEVLDHGPNGYGPGVASSFLQLAYPWARTPIAGSLPEGLESPDGVLTGVLARNALTRGAFRSAAGLHLADVYDVQPLLSDRELPGSGAALADRVSVLGPTPGGLQLLSDVTSSASQTYRPAGVHRLVSVIVRAARRLGEDMVFEASSEALWARLRERLTNLLAALLRAGALRGTTPAQAFQVRCDQSTMTQSDQDNGRVVAYVQFDAAAPIERITVVLAMDEGGQVTLVSAQPNLAEAA